MRTAKASVISAPFGLRPVPPSGSELAWGGPARRSCSLIGSAQAHQPVTMAGQRTDGLLRRASHMLELLQALAPLEVRDGQRTRRETHAVEHIEVVVDIEEVEAAGEVVLLRVADDPPGETLAQHVGEVVAAAVLQPEAR